MVFYFFSRKHGEQNTVPFIWGGPGGFPSSNVSAPLLLFYRRAGGASGGRKAGAGREPRLYGPLHGPGPPRRFASRFGLALLCLFFRSVDYDSGEIVVWACFALCTSSSSSLVYRRFAVPGVAVALPRSRGKTHAHEGSRSQAEFRLVRALRHALPILW